MGRLVNLMVRCGADFSPLARATKKAQQSMSSMQKTSGLLRQSLSAIGVTLSAAAVISFGKACVDAASDLQEVQNVVDATFGEMSGQIDAFAGNAIRNFGLSEKAAKQYSGTMGAVLKSMNVPAKATLEMSKAITGLTGDMASFYNLNAGDAFAKIRSGISGETEPLKQLGINMSIANLEAFAMSQGITKAYRSMTQAEQAVLRYNYLMSVTKDAQGDFARTSGSWANQTRILAEQFNQLKTALGQGLIQVLTPVLGLINQLMGRLVALAQVFSAVTAKLFGKQTAVASAAAEAVESAAEAQNDLAGGIAAAGKEAKKSLAGFDELNVLQSTTAASGGGGAGLADLADTDLSPAEYAFPEVDATGLLKILEPLNKVKGTLLEAVDLFGKIRDLVTGKISFAEFAGSLSPLQTVLVGIAAALAAIAIASLGITVFTTMKDFFLSIKSLNAVGLIGKIAEVFTIAASGAGTLREAMQLVFGPGSLLAGVGALIGGAVLAVMNFASMLQNGFDWANEALMLVGIAIAAVGAMILGAPALVAGVVASLIALVATLAVVFKDELLGAWQIICEKWDAAIAWIADGLAALGDRVINVLQWISDAVNSVLSFFGGGLRFASNGSGMEFSGNVSVPYLAQGAVIPPNREFLAVLGDQAHGTNVEAPLSTIEEAVIRATSSEEQLRLLNAQNDLLRQILERTGFSIDGKSMWSALSPYQRQENKARGW